MKLTSNCFMSVCRSEELVDISTQTPTLIGCILLKISTLSSQNLSSATSFFTSSAAISRASYYDTTFGVLSKNLKIFLKLFNFLNRRHCIEQPAQPTQATYKRRRHQLSLEVYTDSTPKVKTA